MAYIFYKSILDIYITYDILTIFTIIHLNSVQYLQNHNFVPALFFIFSRKDCEKLAKCIQRSLVTSEESSEISRINSIENGIEYSFVEYLRD